MKQRCPGPARQGQQRSFLLPSGCKQFRANNIIKTLCAFGVSNTGVCLCHILSYLEQPVPQTMSLEKQCLSSHCKQVLCTCLGEPRLLSCPAHDPSNGNCLAPTECQKLWKVACTHSVLVFVFRRMTICWEVLFSSQADEPLNYGRTWPIALLNPLRDTGICGTANSQDAQSVKHRLSLMGNVFIEDLFQN